MSKYPLDGPMPDLGTKVLGIASFRNEIVEMAKRGNLTVRQTYERVLPAMGHVTMKGSVKQVCDEIEAWYTEKACDGFNINTPVMPRSLNDFVDLVIPELQRRGLFRKEYQGKTLRERMGLPLPTDPWTAKQALAAE
jgi:alkanesulfonate monooxygenase SsuD/methylene tetrahydromethanopterin reductase-like flavin-dependent oxidoreductase (luciferase family)